MEKINHSINNFLPYGESLRILLQHPTIKDSDIKKLLRIKGVYVDDSSNDTTLPLLTTCLISPLEFGFIKERLQEREDREKTITRNFEWISDSNLLSAIPNNFNIQEIIKTTFPKYKVVGQPNFKMVNNNPDKIILNFKCETENYSKDWYRIKNEFKGSVILEKVVKNNKIQLKLIHTSSETTEICNKVIKALEKHFKENSMMDPKKEIERILYCDFTNEERVAFFLSFTGGNQIFDFRKALKLDIGPDPSLSLPENINWLDLAKVKELNINGEVLHEIYFIKDQSLHQFMELCEIEILYNFSLPYAEGSCIISLAFKNYFHKRLTNIEFVVDIPKINLKSEYLHLAETSVRRDLIDEFEKFKTEQYDYFKAKNLYKQYTVPATV